MRAGPARHARRRPATGRDAAAAELADAFCRQARLRVDELFDQLWHNTDDVSTRALARRVLAGRYTWLEDGVIDPSRPGPLIADAEPGPATENVHRRII